MAKIDKLKEEAVVRRGDITMDIQIIGNLLFSIGAIMFFAFIYKMFKADEAGKAYI